MPTPKHPSKYDQTYLELMRRGAESPVTVELEDQWEAHALKRYLHVMLRVMRESPDTVPEDRKAAESVVVRWRDRWVRVEPKERTKPARTRIQEAMGNG